MRHIVLVFLIFVALPATSQSPTLLYGFGCFDDLIVVQFKVSEPGIYELTIPHKTCGVGV